MLKRMTKDKIEKQIELDAPVERVWLALTDSQQFGAWFGVIFETAFKLGKPAVGKITTKGYEHLTWNADVTKMEFQRIFAFQWHPYGIDPKVDYSKEEKTTVEFALERLSKDRTLLKVTESGFDRIPAARRDEAFRMNEKGWEIQTTQIAAFLAKGS
jgi:uncharacterized protein YndB with AHSA1/START domain